MYRLGLLFFAFVILNCQYTFADFSANEINLLKEEIRTTIQKLDLPEQSGKHFVEKVKRLCNLDEKYSRHVESEILNRRVSQFKAFSTIENSYQRDSLERDITPDIGTYYMSYEIDGKIFIVYANYFLRISPYNKEKFSYPFIVHLLIYTKKEKEVVFSSSLPFVDSIPDSWFSSKYYSPYFLGVNFANKSSIPDIFILFGPDGSGNFATIYRYRWQKDKEVWQYEKIWFDKTQNKYSINREKLIFTTSEGDSLLKDGTYWP